jgi:hypothetical protein
MKGVQDPISVKIDWLALYLWPAAGLSPALDGEEGQVERDRDPADPSN